MTDRRNPAAQATSETASGVSRRGFLAAAAAAPLANWAVAAPAVHTAPRALGETIVGEGDRKYRIDHDLFHLPGEYHWQITHNVATDSQGRVYVIHEGDASKTDHPAIFVFDADGTFVTAFGSHLQGGGHGLECRNEGGEDFLYVTAYQGLKFWEKMTTAGERVWQRFAPMESGRYAAGEDTNPQKEWGRDRFMPTNTASLSDGRLVLADGYGAHCLHVYDADANYLSTIGKPGTGEGEFNLPHGLWIDARGEEELIVVSDRANNRLQWLRPDGTHVRTEEGYLLPANCDVRDDLLLVPELRSRITVLGGDGQPVCVVGDDAEWRAAVGADGNALRRTPDKWQEGRLVHPHDACFDADGNILLAEWVATGRVSKLSPV